jgi:hypothetical protein
MRIWQGFPCASLRKFIVVCLQASQACLLNHVEHPGKASRAKRDRQYADVADATALLVEIEVTPAHAALMGRHSSP